MRKEARAFDFQYRLLEENIFIYQPQQNGYIATITKTTGGNQEDYR